jgi:type VI secretion system protein ImpJ
MQVHWHEGLFLLPHHLQRLQRNFGESISVERKRIFYYGWGLIDAHLSVDDLENMLIRFDRLHAIMPSGQEVRFPKEAELPIINIKQVFESRGRFTVYLAVPRWFDSRANSVDPGQSVDPRAKILYRIVESEISDENTGANPKPLLERRVNARLILDHEDTSDLEVLPLLRVTRAAGDEVGLPRRDPEFSGPCLILNGSPVLRDLVRDITSQVSGSRQELTVQIARGGFSIDTMRGIQFEQMLRLRTLNHYGARLEALMETENLTPFDVYVDLLELMGELSALYPDRDLYEAPPYKHEDPYPCFSALATKIRQLLRGSVVSSFLRIPFTEEAKAVHRGLLTDEHFLRPSDYFIGIQTKEDPRGLAMLVEDPDKFKLMPASMAGRAIRGVMLKEERFPPLELPAQSNLYYFRLLRSESVRSWQQIQSEKAAIVRWSGNENADYNISLYMTMPKTD